MPLAGKLNELLFLVVHISSCPLPLSKRVFERKCVRLTFSFSCNSYDSTVRRGRTCYRACITRVTSCGNMVRSRQDNNDNAFQLCCNVARLVERRCSPYHSTFYSLDCHVTFSSSSHKPILRDMRKTQ